MYFLCKCVAAFSLITVGLLALAEPKPLRVCADSNNLPFSNDQRQGFENKLAAMVARDLGRRLQYIWWPQSPGRAERMFRQGACDLVLEVPTKAAGPNATRSYYSSGYVFVTRKDRRLALRSFDDPVLRTLRIGLPLLGDDGGYIPPQQELASRGMVQNVVGYSVFGDFSKPNPPADLIRAVARREVDVAIAWGPLAGYFSRNSDVPLKISPICANTTNPGLPLTFSISMRVSSGQKDLLSQLNAEIERRSHEIRTLLRAYGVPLLDAPFITRSCK